MSTKFLLFLSVFVLGGLLLVACAPAAEPFVCDDPIGCVDYAADDPIRIASALVISGPNTELGLDSQIGVEVALAMREEVLGHAVELQTEDDGCSAEGGQTSATKIVSDPQIVAMIGTLSYLLADFIDAVLSMTRI